MVLKHEFISRYHNTAVQSDQTGSDIVNIQRPDDQEYETETNREQRKHRVTNISPIYNDGKLAFPTRILDARFVLSVRFHSYAKTRHEAIKYFALSHENTRHLNKIWTRK